MSKVPVLPPSGFRDFLPGEAATRLSLIETITAVYLSHGFQAIGMPVMENLSTLQGKGGGGDNEKLIFKVMNRGDALYKATASLATKVINELSIRGIEFSAPEVKGLLLTELKEKPALYAIDELADMGMRFDLTLPLARYCARFREQLPKPFKVFQIGPVWRADRPQKGRFREFFQCDVDIVGSKEIGAEADCISAIVEVFIKLGIDEVEVHLNDRRILQAIGAGVDVKVWSEALTILDKLDKIGAEGVESELKEKFGHESVPRELLSLILGKILTARPDDFAASCPESAESLNSLLEILKVLLPGVKCVFNPTLVRGQDYYTGTIFELRHPKLAGSLAGGGRYNRLLEVFGGAETPAFGGSIGFERLFLLLQESGRAESLSQPPQVFFPLFDASLRTEVLKLASALRKAGIAADVFPDAAKLKNQFKYADDRGIPFTAILGSDELAKGEIKVKSMSDRSEQSISIQPIDTFVKRMKELCRP